MYPLFLGHCSFFPDEKSNLDQVQWNLFTFILSPGLVLDGGSDSIYSVLFVKDIVPGSVAFEEGSLRPLDLIHYINGAPTQDLTLNESTRLLELSLDNLSLKATR